ATAFGYWSDELGQVREAYPDGRYYAIGGGDEAFRVALMPSGNATRLLVVEGPFDALAVVQAVGLHGLEAMWLWVAALCGGKIPEERPKFNAVTQVWTMFDAD